MQNEVQNQKQKFICCCCCKSGPLSGMIRLNRSGFVPGETLDFITEILNMSSRDCTPCVRLCMVSHILINSLVSLSISIAKYDYIYVCVSLWVLILIITLCNFTLFRNTDEVYLFS